MSEDKETIQDALFKFQQDFKGVEKRRKNTFTNSLYASLDDVINAAKPLLNELGLRVNYLLQFEGERSTLKTTVTHKSGETIESVSPLSTNNTPQQFGSELTYLRRYTLCCLLNIVETDDDDGNAGEKPQGIPKLTEKQHGQIIDLIEATNTDNKVFKDKYLAPVFHVDTVEQLDTRQASVAIKTLEQKLKRIEADGTAKQ